MKFFVITFFLLFFTACSATQKNNPFYGKKIEGSGYTGLKISLKQTPQGYRYDEVVAYESGKFLVVDAYMFKPYPRMLVPIGAPHLDEKQTLKAMLEADKHGVDNRVALSAIYNEYAKSFFDYETKADEVLDKTQFKTRVTDNSGFYFSTTPKDFTPLYFKPSFFPIRPGKLFAKLDFDDPDIIEKARRRVESDKSSWASLDDPASLVTNCSNSGQRGGFNILVDCDNPEVITNGEGYTITYSVTITSVENIHRIYPDIFYHQNSDIKIVSDDINETIIITNKTRDYIAFDAITAYYEGKTFTFGNLGVSIPPYGKTRLKQSYYEMVRRINNSGFWKKSLTRDEAEKNQIEVGIGASYSVRGESLTLFGKERYRVIDMVLQPNRWGGRKTLK